MHVVHLKKKDSNVLTIRVNPLRRRGKAVHGKAGIHRDKRRKARVNERIALKREE